MRRWVAVLAVGLVLGACGGDDDDASSAPTTDDTETTTAVDTGCVLEDGATLTEDQLDSGYCTFADDPNTIMATIFTDCPDGSTLYVAGTSEDDPNGGWAFVVDGEGTWHTGAYAEVYKADCSAP